MYDASMRIFHEFLPLHFPTEPERIESKVSDRATKLSRAAVEKLHLYNKDSPELEIYNCRSTYICIKSWSDPWTGPSGAVSSLTERAPLQDCIYFSQKSSAAHGAKG